MTRPLLPPKYVNGSINVLKACNEKPAAFYTYMVLRALAWGESSLRVTKGMLEVLENEFGIGRATFYRHLHWLASPEIHAVLRFGSASGYTQVEFVSDVDSLENETPVSELRFAYSSSSIHTEDSTEEEKKKDSIKNAKSRKNETAVAKMRLPQTPREAQENPDIQAFTAICNRFPGMRDYGLVIDTIQLLREKHGDQLVEKVKPFWLAWSTRVNRFGQHYDPASLVWLTEWAVNGQIPRDGNGKNGTGRQEKAVDPVVLEKARKAAQSLLEREA